MKYLCSILAVFIFAFSSCSQNDEATVEILDEQIYFPPINSQTWETINPSSLSWDSTKLQELKQFLEETDTEGFIILKNGKIAVEYYLNGTNISTPHLWNSAGKTLTAFTIGMAQKDGYLSTEDSASQYLGSGWTSMTTEQEAAITIKNQLTMTTGGDYNVADETCTDAECLRYLNEPDTFWYYHNAFYTLLQNVIDEAVPNGFDTYFTSNLKNKIGMTGGWFTFGHNHVYISTARSMARFGLLNLNGGKWEENELIAPEYFQQMTNTSQNLNKAYGYLWWLNGKESFRLPTSTNQFSGKLIPNAPDDLIAGLGKDDQKLYVVPSENLVIVRMGTNAGSPLLGPSGYDNELWEKLNEVFNF